MKPKIQKPNRRHERKKEEKLCGVSACLKAFEKRASDIKMLYVTKAASVLVSPILQFCKDQKKPYEVLSKEKITSFSKMEHHEGVCLLLNKKKILPFIKDPSLKEKKALVLALERIENPHNLGAILRSAAHFGASALLVLTDTRSTLPASSLRTAEGGAESVPVYFVKSWEEELRFLKKEGYSFFATSSHGGADLYQTDFSKKTVLFLGSEKEGLSEGLLKKIENRIQISGTGEVESLNVSVASALLLSEWWRQDKKNSL